MKGLIPLVDVARFMARDFIRLAMTVKEVANICKEFQPNLTITETDDEIPNLVYYPLSTLFFYTGKSEDG